MKNAIGREIPETIRGIKKFRLYDGEFTDLPKHTGTARTIRISLPHTNKILSSIEEAIEKTGLKDGMTISFHHHLRNGDYLMQLVVRAIAKKGIKDITIASSSLSPCHDFLIDYIKEGTITALESSGLRGSLGKFICANPSILKKPVIIRSHEDFSPKTRHMQKFSEIWHSLPNHSLFFSMFVTTFFIQLALFSIEPVITIYVRMLSVRTDHLAFISGLVFASSGVSTMLFAP